jgi:hypothetical protein
MIFMPCFINVFFKELAIISPSRRRRADSAKTTTLGMLFTQLPSIPVFAVVDDEIVVIAVAHGRRHPDYWVKRVG